MRTYEVDTVIAMRRDADSGAVYNASIISSEAQLTRFISNGAPLFQDGERDLMEDCAYFFLISHGENVVATGFNHFEMCTLLGNNKIKFIDDVSTPNTDFDDYLVLTEEEVSEGTVFEAKLISDFNDAKRLAKQHSDGDDEDWFIYGLRPLVQYHQVIMSEEINLI